MVDILEKSLRGKLEIEVGVDLYRDTGIEGGDLYNQHLATALCESACMVLAFTAGYFDLEHNYCTREYKTMEDLEAHRLNALGLSTPTHGLIIPIILGARRKLPPEIKSKRQFHDFTGFRLSDPELERHPSYASKIAEIAEYIGERYDELSKLPESFQDNCVDFKLLPEATILDWLKNVKSSPAPLPR